MIDSETLQAIETALEIVCFNWNRFSYFDMDDLRQEGRLAAIKALKRKQPNGDMTPFLIVVIRNHLRNLKRNHNSGHPCYCQCGGRIPDCAACLRHAERNRSKKGISQPLFLDWETKGRTQSLESEIELRDLLRKIDEELSPELLPYWELMRRGEKIHHRKRQKVVEAIAEILGDDMPQPPPSPRNRKITFNGRSQTIGEWASELGVSYQAIVYRLKKWPLEKALTVQRTDTGCQKQKPTPCPSR